MEGMDFCPRRGSTYTCMISSVQNLSDVLQITTCIDNIDFCSVFEISALVAMVHNFNTILWINICIWNIGFCSKGGDFYTHIVSIVHNFNCVLFTTTYIQIKIPSFEEGLHNFKVMYYEILPIKLWELYIYYVPRLYLYIYERENS